MPILKQKIQQEVTSGRIAGPFKSPPFQNLRISPLGLVPKKAPGEFRIIQHLSSPEGNSINDSIPEELCSVHYQNINDAVKLVQEFGQGCLLAKIDIQDSFRISPVHGNDCERMGFCIENEYDGDKVLPQGLSLKVSVQLCTL